MNSHQFQILGLQIIHSVALRVENACHKWLMMVLIFNSTKAWHLSQAAKCHVLVCLEWSANNTIKLKSTSTAEIQVLLKHILTLSTVDSLINWHLD
jgi:hypothetical protein